MLETSGKIRGKYELGSLIVDLDSYSARIDERDLEITSSQLELLALLMANKHRVVDRAELAGMLDLRHERTVDVLLTGLRQQMGRDFVRNVRSRGWIIDPKALA